MTQNAAQKHTTTCGFDILIINTHNGVNANGKRSKRNGHPAQTGTTGGRGCKQTIFEN